MTVNKGPAGKFPEGRLQVLSLDQFITASLMFTIKPDLVTHSSKKVWCFTDHLFTSILGFTRPA